MKILFTLFLVAFSAATLPAHPQASAPQALASYVGADAINTLCPIGKEAIDGETFATYEGHKIGFCCGGCDSKFLAWSKDKKDAFVQASLRQDASAGQSEDANQREMEVEPYTLTSCPVSGEALGSMGEPLEVTVQGRLVKLCCKGCTKKLEAEPQKYLEVVDAALAAQQRPYYMVDTCVVSGEPLVEDGEDIGVDVVIKNRLFRVCCKGCIKKLEKDPARYRDVLNEKIAAAQRPHYPLDHCLVRGEKSKLGAMGEPYEVVVGNRLARFCCKGCLPKFQEKTATFLAQLDTAWAPVLAKQAGGHAEKEHAGGGHGHKGEHEGHGGDHH
jgi:hypothetical protein